MLMEIAIGAGVVAAIPTIMDMFWDDGQNAIMPHSELRKLKGDGIQISKNVQLNRKMSKEHILKIAPSGGYKSRGFIMPNVKQLNNCSMIVTDPSGEIQETCKRDDMNILTFNPLHPGNSIGFNPLANCKNSFEVKQIMEVIMNNSHDKSSKSDKTDWIQMSLPLLKAYAVYNFYAKKYPFDIMVSNILTKPLLPIKDKKVVSIYEEIMASEVNEAKTELLAFLQVNKAQSTLACIRNTLTSALQIFNEVNVKKLCRKPVLNFEKLREHESILYIQVPERYSKHYSPITAVLIQQLMDRLLDKPNGLDVFFLLDELCNIGKISDINSYLSTCRKHNISIVGCIQNLTQLKRVYGEIEGKELQELFKTLIVSGGLKDSNSYFSDLIGTKKVKEKEVEKRVPLLEPHELRQLDDNKVIILCKNKRAVKDNICKLAI